MLDKEQFDDLIDEINLKYIHTNKEMKDLKRMLNAVHNPRIKLQMRSTEYVPIN